MKLLQNFFWVLLLLQTACFEIIEETHIQENGAGSLKIILNMSQSKSKISSLMALDSLNGYKIPKIAEIKSKIAEINAKLSEQDGISQVQTETNFEEFIFVVSCQFTDAQKLDQAIVQTIRYFDKQKTEIPENNFLYQNKTLSRKFDQLAEKIVLKDQKLKESLSQAFYTSIYRMPNSIFSVSNPDFKLSKSKKASLFKASVWEIISKQKSISVTIRHQ